MSMDKSLKRKGGMIRNRCVLKRSERILKMLEEGKFPDGRSPFGLPKTRVQKVVLKKKVKKEETAAAGEAGAAGAPGAPGAAGAAAAPTPAPEAKPAGKPGKK
jgi:small basic protein (TIGR04137 family)